MNFRRVRSFVLRNSRLTQAQSQAYSRLWVDFGLQPDKELDPEEVFARKAPLALEIGFGSGHSLLHLAQLQPDWDFIGIETYRSGIGALLRGIEKNNLKNLRIYEADAVDVLQKCIPDRCLSRIHIFFPDPWQKRKHHQRRLIQNEFVSVLISKLQDHGELHLATDWEDYAEHMLRVLRSEKQLSNLSPNHGFSEVRSTQRPMMTKFEARALKEGRQIFELQFAKSNVSR